MQLATSNLTHAVAIASVCAVASGCQFAAPRTIERSPTALFCGQVRKVGESPRAWSGVGAAYQTVTFEVVEVWAGALPNPTVKVGFLLVPSAPYLRNGEPELSARVFREGARLAVWAKVYAHPEQLHSHTNIREDVAVFPCDDVDFSRCSEAGHCVPPAERDPALSGKGPLRDGQTR